MKWEDIEGFWVEDEYSLIWICDFREEVYMGDKIYELLL